MKFCRDILDTSVLWRGLKSYTYQIDQYFIDYPSVSFIKGWIINTFESLFDFQVILREKISVLFYVLKMEIAL